MTDNVEIDIVCITEHWLNKFQIQATQLNNFKTNTNFCRKKYCHGGSIILIKDTLKSSPLGDIDTFLNIIHDALLLITSTETKNIYLAGDFNINFLTETPHRRRLEELLLSFNLRKIFNTPSRITQSSHTCIDNIFTDLPENEISQKTINIHLSDHLAQIIEIPAKTNKEDKKPYPQQRNINEKNINTFTTGMACINWGILKKKNAEEAYNYFHDALHKKLSTKHQKNQNKYE